MREVAFRLVPRPGTPPGSLPLALAEGTRALVVETAVTHLDEAGDVWRILHAHGPPAEVALARGRFAAWSPPALLEKEEMAATAGRLVLWYKYAAEPEGRLASQTALAFRRLGRATVVTDVARAGTLTFRVLAPRGPVAQYVREARALAEGHYDFTLLHVGPPREPDAARLDADEERVLAAALKHGLFDVPRRGEIADVARDVGLSPSSVSARLRKATGKLAEAWLGAR